MVAAPPANDAVPGNDLGLVHLSAAGVSILIDARGPRLPAVVHWGAALGDAPPGQLADLALAGTAQAADGAQALYAITATATSASYPPGAATLPGLDQDRTYRVGPQPPGDVADGNAAAWGAGLPWWTPQGVQLSGRALGTAGLRLPVLYPDRVVLLRVTTEDQPHAGSDREAVSRG